MADKKPNSFVDINIFRPPDALRGNGHISDFPLRVIVYEVFPQCMVAHL
jgi:hypothetical protein